MNPSAPASPESAVDLGTCLLCVLRDGETPHRATTRYDGRACCAAAYKVMLQAKRNGML